MTSIILAGRYRLHEVCREQPPFLTYHSQDLINNKNCLITVTPHSQTFEATFRRIQSRMASVTHILQYGEYGTSVIDNKKYFFVVVETSAASLQSIFDELERSFCQHTLSVICYHSLRALQEIHENGLVHGRLHPNNLFLYVRDNQRFSSICMDITSMHFFQTGLKNQKQKHCKYSSLGHLLGLKPCPKDDLEMLMYILLDFGSKADLFSFQTIDRLHSNDPKLQNYKRRDLAALTTKFLPQHICDLYFYVMNLNRDETPNYFYWLKKLQRILGYDKDNFFPVVSENCVFEEDHQLELRMTYSRGRPCRLIKNKDGIRPQSLMKSSKRSEIKKLTYSVLEEDQIQEVR